MFHLAGYRIKEEISKSDNSTIYRGSRNSDNCPVVIKLLNREYPTSKELSAFVREYEIMDKLSGDGIIKAYSITKCNNSLAIIMEDIGGESVARVLKSVKAGIAERLSLAIQMTHSLIQTHQQNIIHKDVNPTNFIWNYGNNRVKIIDFGISAELARESSQSIDLNTLEGTLNYISPEQTGRINRPIDYRTDLYSLGITFYELFTGKLPFTGEDESEIVYGHIAKTPISPKEINPEIPTALSEIIMKMISKTTEDRYQSALGLKKDLEYCLQMLEGKREIVGFIPGEGDILDRFEIPHKLYGREEEIRTMIDGFEKAAEGYCELLLVSGFSGIGKSSLIQELRKPVAGKKGFYISGKCNQFERNIPYHGLIKAFQGMIKQLLSESQSNLDNWRRLLTEALGCNAQVILDVIPELEQIIGPQPEVSELNPLEAQNRFKLVFLEFIKTFAELEHPLVIFIDDLQWSDASTLELLKYILGAGSARYIYLVGAYRDNEVQDGHPLQQLLKDLESNYQGIDRPYRQIALKPLEADAVNRMISDTLHCHPDETEPLTELVFHKTKGNPFFIDKLLNMLYFRGSFTFLPERGQWDYDLEKVEAAEISDNVVELLVKGLESLPAVTLDILKLACCIGNQFDLTMISLIRKKPIAELGKDLWIAIEREIILPLNYNYRLIRAQKSIKLSQDFDVNFSFAHDRIRQAVLSLISETEKSEIHLSIGRVYLKTFRETNRADSLFDMVNHLNIGRALIREENERAELSKLNATAGNRAKKSGAFAAAASYFETAEALLTAEEWCKIHNKLFDVKLEHATCALLSGDLSRADELCEDLSQAAVTNIDKGAVSNVKVQILEFQGRLFDAIAEIRRSLMLFGVSLPENEQEIGMKIQEGVMKMQAFLAQTPADELVNLPEMKSPDKIMVMQLLFQVVPPALQTNPSLYILASLMMFEMTCTYGTSPLSCKCFTDCGIVMATMLKDYKTSYRLGEAAFSLINKFNTEALKAAVYFGFTFCSHWRAHYKESLEYYDMAYRKGLETGDIQHAAYALSHRVHLLMWVGRNLTELKQETENAIVVLGRTKTAMPLLLTEIINYIIKKFQTVPEKEDGSDFEKEDQEMIVTIEKTRDLSFLCRFFQYNTYESIISSNLEAAEKWSDMAEALVFAGLSDFPIPDHYLFRALILVNKWKIAAAEEKPHIKETLADIRQKIKVWADNCPDNFAHKYYLLSAEMAVIDNEPLDIVVDFYIKAINSIGNNDFIQLKALINELYGKFWLDRGDETTGKAYIREAEYLYRQWGAHRKAALLEKQYSHYFTSDEAQHGVKGTFSTTTHISIDVNSILKSTQAISSEIKIEKLLTILIRTMIENAGAQRGCLLLRNEADGQFYIEAVQDVDSNRPQVMQSLPFAESSALCPEIVQYVTRTRETIVIHNACKDVNYQNNAYITRNRIKSLLCMPVIYQNRLKGVVYLENNLSDSVFTSERLEILKILSSQASISIENAGLYENMEEKVRERTIQLNNANEKLRELSFHDPLTDLYNRRYTFEFIYDKVTQFIQHKKRIISNGEKRNLSTKDNVIGVFLIDIDHFKEVNDTYGHSVGDNVLIAMSKILKQVIRTEDFLVRWGGEEFLIILSNTKPEYLERFCRRVLTAVRETPLPVSEDKTIYKTCSLGYVQMPLDATDPGLLNLEQMINISDYALYCAKENGRNCAAHFKLIKPIGTDEEFKRNLMNLSRNTELNEEHFNIDYIQA
ncbi:MAG TPA: diguanylate cyclase [Clostridia bacterium]|nr:diguanylate cyclase [Clostridia bacterium]